MIRIELTHDQDIVGSNPAVYWMDVSDKASYYIEKKKNKGSQMGHTKKKYIKKKKKKKDINCNLPEWSLLWSWDRGRWCCWSASTLGEAPFRQSIPINAPKDENMFGSLFAILVNNRGHKLTCYILKIVHQWAIYKVKILKTR